VKNQKFYLLSLLFFLSGFSFADDLSQEIKLEIDTYTQDLHSKDIDTVILTADKISASGLSDPVLFDNVEQVLLNFHQRQIANPGDKTLPPPVISLIRALGSSGNYKYSTTLNNILEESPSRAARNRAKHVLSKINWYKQRNTLMQDLSHREPGQSLQTTRLLNLLNNNSFTFRRYGAEEIYRLGEAEPAVLSLMANDLKTNASSTMDNIQTDTRAWYCRVLGKVGGAEYRNFIQSVIDDKNTHSKIKKHCKKELSRNK
jgi:hypothetical protein